MMPAPPGGSRPSAPDPGVHFQVLDALRFLCASIVVLSHIQPLNSSLPHWAKSAIFVGFDGVWAVMAFFVISGLCIHLPQALGRELDVRSFYAARFCRIVIPMLVAIAVALLLPRGLESLDAVLWSLYCEIGYYIVYPALLRLLRAYGVARCLAVAFAAALGLATFPDGHDGFFWTYGPVGTTVLGLPVWLLGCLLAEILSRPAGKMIPPIPVGTLRILVLVAGAVLRALHIISPIKLKFSLLIMSPLCAFWLLAELRQRRVPGFLARLAPLGAASYSLYLMHKLAPPLVAAFMPGLADGSYAWWLVTLVVAAALTWAFYTVVEKPSHRLARHASRLLRRREPQPEGLSG
jgi:peptidoglycan/LPS O-acetylase OafA/YrhL